MPRLKEGAAPPSGASLEKLEQHKAEIRRELEKARGEDQARVDKLEADLKEANDWIAARKKADETRENQSSETTIVVPPNTIAPTAGNEGKPTDDNNSPNEQPKKRGGWKRVW